MILFLGMAFTKLSVAELAQHGAWLAALKAIFN